MKIIKDLNQCAVIDKTASFRDLHQYLRVFYFDSD